MAGGKLAPSVLSHHIGQNQVAAAAQVSTYCSSLSYKVSLRMCRYFDCFGKLGSTGLALRRIHSLVFGDLMLMRRKNAALFCLVVLALQLVLISCGGSGGGNNGRSGTVAGTIRDTGSGTAIAGATVSVFNGLTQLGTTTTDANGDYTLNVQAGDGYTIQVSAPGYATLNQNSVTVAENATTTFEPSGHLRHRGPLKASSAISFPGWGSPARPSMSTTALR